MLSTYQKYVSAVANWKKAARWWLTKHESALKSLERESQKAHLKLAKAGTDEQQERTAMADITRIEQRMIAEERAVQKEKRYWLEDWYQDQEEKAYDKLEAAVRKIDERIKKLNEKKPR